MAEETKILSKKTLLPIGVVTGLLIGAVGVGSWVASVDSAIEANMLSSAENKVHIQNILDDVKGYDDRLARVETKIDLLLDRLNIQE